MLLDHSFLRSEWRAAHCPLKPPGEHEAEEKTHALIRTHGAPAYSESFIHLTAAAFWAQETIILKPSEDEAGGNYFYDDGDQIESMNY
ncbi:hypothetical protein MHYP_G00342100 [Metynnis hypsauchen]